MNEFNLISAEGMAEDIHNGFSQESRELHSRMMRQLVAELRAHQLVSGVELIEELEWNGEVRGPGSGPHGSGGDGELYQSCPVCGGLRGPNSSFVAEAVGHQAGCGLARLLGRPTGPAEPEPEPELCEHVNLSAEPRDANGMRWYSCDVEGCDYRVGEVGLVSVAPASTSLGRGHNPGSGYDG